MSRDLPLREWPAVVHLDGSETEDGGVRLARVLRDLRTDGCDRLVLVSRAAAARVAEAAGDETRSMEVVAVLTDAEPGSAAAVARARDTLGPCPGALIMDGSRAVETDLGALASSHETSGASYCVRKDLDLARGQ